MQPNSRFTCMYSGYILSFRCRKRDRGLLSRVPGEAAAIEHKGVAGDRFSRVGVICVVGVAIGGDLEVAVRSIGKLVACCAAQVTKDPFDGEAVSGLWVGHELCDLLDRVSDRSEERR